MAAYKKHIYWIDPTVHGGALAELRKDKKRIHKAKHTPCESLYPRREFVLVEPRVWDLRCMRQGSWYRGSCRNGQSLLVTNQPLNEFPLWGTVTLEPFDPPRTARDEDVVEILSDKSLLEFLPEGWGLFSTWEVQAIESYLASEGVERSLEQVFTYYTANHLNFVFPRFFVRNSHGVVIPYSIQKTALVCSACVEIFGILGEGHPQKFLAPCPGLKYVKPGPGHYLLVTNECTE
jgi:hypothetical protein